MIVGPDARLDSTHVNLQLNGTSQPPQTYSSPTSQYSQGPLLQFLSHQQQLQVQIHHVYIS